MIDVDGDAEGGQRARRRDVAVAGPRIERFAEVERLLHRVDAGAVGGVHRMQRLDRERHADVLRVLERRGDAVADVAARREQVLRLRRAGERARQAADDEDEARRPELPGLVDRAPVVVERGARGRPRPSPGTCRRGSSPRARARGCARARRCARSRSHGPGRATARWRECPGATHASMIVSSVPAPRSVAVLIESQRWSAEKSRTAVGARLGTQPSMPCSASRWRMRATASSGCSSRPARVGEAEDLGEVAERARALLAADHREVRLVAVQPGEEDDAGLVEACRRLEDVARERHRRREDRVEALDLARRSTPPAPRSPPARSRRRCRAGRRCAAGSCAPPTPSPAISSA